MLIDLQDKNYKIKDIDGNFVKLKAILKNDSVKNWIRITLLDDSEIICTKDHPFITAQGETIASDIKEGGFLLNEYDDEVQIVSIEDIDKTDDSYDVVTESGTFLFSGIQSHNCRTRLFNDVYGKNTSSKRGNASFTSINLPRLAIKADKNIDKFFKLLDEKLELCHDQLLERFNYQCTATADEFKYMAENNTQSEDFKKSGKIYDALKHSSLSIGFIGLAETLIALTGKHHGESKESQELGLKIVKHMRDYCDAKKDEEQLNWSLLGTPAEGLSERFVKIDKKIYGEIPGVTDKDYYTNSSHVPVYYDISAFDKIDIEAPYHALENAGHIAYIELDGDPTQNIDALEAIVKHMHDAHIGYGAINHPVDSCRECGYKGAGIEKCPMCGSTNIEKLRRITGYLVGTLERWNNGKKAEESERVKHGTPFNENGVYTQEEKAIIEEKKLENSRATQI